MVFSYYLLKIPYGISWRFLRLIRRQIILAVYCAEPLDYIHFEAIKDYLPETVVVANRSTREYLKARGIESTGLPAFPKAVIMFRHALHKFPEHKMVKIGLRHGPYHFKKYTSAKSYNAFDVYLMTSTRDVQEGKKVGITSAVAGGYPKIDALVNGNTDPQKLARIKKEAAIDPAKKTVLFTATWDGSGMSAVGRWAGRLAELTKKYNVLVTVHPWTSAEYIKQIRQTESVYFIQDPDTNPYLALADLLVADSSSIIAEYCALDRPIVTFRVPSAKRSVPEVIDIINKISTRIDRFEELKPAIEKSLSDPQALSSERQEANQIMFDKLDGRAGKKAATIILDRLNQSGIDAKVN